MLSRSCSEKWTLKPTNTTHSTSCFCLRVTSTSNSRIPRSSPVTIYSSTKAKSSSAPISTSSAKWASSTHLSRSTTWKSLKLTTGLSLCMSWSGFPRRKGSSRLSGSSKCSPHRFPSQHLSSRLNPAAPKRTSRSSKSTHSKSQRSSFSLLPNRQAK